MASVLIVGDRQCRVSLRLPTRRNHNWTVRCKRRAEILHQKLRWKRLKTILTARSSRNRRPAPSPMLTSYLAMFPSVNSTISRFVRLIVPINLTLDHDGTAGDKSDPKALSFCSDCRRASDCRPQDLWQNGKNLIGSQNLWRCMSSHRHSPLPSKFVESVLFKGAVSPTKRPDSVVPLNAISVDRMCAPKILPHTSRHQNRRRNFVGLSDASKELRSLLSFLCTVRQ
jgi:hypothetical protein